MHLWNNIINIFCVYYIRKCKHCPEVISAHDRQISNPEASNLFRNHQQSCKRKLAKLQKDTEKWEASKFELPAGGYNRLQMLESQYEEIFDPIEIFGEENRNLPGNIVFFAKFTSQTCMNPHNKYINII